MIRRIQNARKDAPRSDRPKRVRRATAVQGAGDAPEKPGPLDGGIVAASALLAGVGIVMVYSATAPLAMGRALPPHFIRHLAAVFAGIVCIAVVVRVPIGVWRRFALPLWALGTALLVWTLTAGIEANGAQRWIALPGTGLRLQAAEFVKWATVLAIAALCARFVDRRGAAGKRAVVLAAAVMLPPSLLLLAQPDFGSAAVLAAIVGMLLFVAGVPFRHLLAPVVVAGVGAAGYIATHPYAMARLRGFVDPWSRARQEGFQLVQSFIAFGRGGVLGVGIGDGRQKLYYLPEAHTDFILAGIAEELGLIGVLAVLGAFAALVWAGTRIAKRAREPLAALVAIGMTSLIGIPAAINASVVMGLLPTTGFTLPFVSYGGNSLLICSLAVGILLRIGACEAAPVQTRISGASRRRIGRR